MCAPAVGVSPLAWAGEEQRGLQGSERPAVLGEGGQGGLGKDRVKDGESEQGRGWVWDGASEGEGRLSPQVALEGSSSCLPCRCWPPTSPCVAATGLPGRPAASALLLQHSTHQPAGPTAHRRGGHGPCWHCSCTLPPPRGCPGPPEPQRQHRALARTPHRQCRGLPRG